MLLLFLFRGRGLLALRRSKSVRILTAAVQSKPPSARRPTDVDDIDEDRFRAARDSPKLSELRAVHWNVELALNEPPRMAQIGRFLRRAQVDVVGFNELGGSERAFESAAAEAGFEHTIFLRANGGRFHLGLMAREPFSRVLKRTAGFSRGLLCAHLESSPLRICETHLSPHARAHRLAEVGAINAALRLDDEVASSLPVSPLATLLLGDLNALTRDDADVHARLRLAERLAEPGADKHARIKFLAAGTADSSADGGGEGDRGHGGASGGGEDGFIYERTPPTSQLDYSVMDALGAAGWEDLVVSARRTGERMMGLQEQGGQQAWGRADGQAGLRTSTAGAAGAHVAWAELEASQQSEWSVPSRIADELWSGSGGRGGARQDAVHALPMRLDYALLLRHGLPSRMDRRGSEQRGRHSGSCERTGFAASARVIGSGSIGRQWKVAAGATAVATVAAEDEAATARRGRGWGQHGWRSVLAIDPLFSPEELVELPSLSDHLPVLATLTLPACMQAEWWAQSVSTPPHVTKAETEGQEDGQEEDGRTEGEEDGQQDTQLPANERAHEGGAGAREMGQPSGNMAASVAPMNSAQQASLAKAVARFAAAAQRCAPAEDASAGVASASVAPAPGGAEPSGAAQSDASAVVISRAVIAQLLSAETASECAALGNLTSLALLRSEQLRWERLPAQQQQQMQPQHTGGPSAHGDAGRSREVEPLPDDALGNHSWLAQAAADAAANQQRLWRSCAVVGSSGLLALRPQGARIDRHDAVFRMNGAPVRGFEGLVGSRTTVRLVNAPQSARWQQEVAQGKGLPPQMADAEIVITPLTPRRFASGAQPPKRGNAAKPGAPLAGAAAPAPSKPPLLVRGGPLVAQLASRFRRRCVLPFFTRAQLDAHRASTVTGRSGSAAKPANFTPTFGFETIVHALYSCESVHAYGFYLDASGGADAEGARAKRLRSEGTSAQASGAPAPALASSASAAVPYHYYESKSFDKAAADPRRPWTFKSHNYTMEADALMAMAGACALTVHI